MGNFNQALIWLKEGKNVGRKNIKNPRWHLYVGTEKGYIGFIYHYWSEEYTPELWQPDIESFEASDWEIFEYPKDCCCNCAIEILCEECKKKIREDGIKTNKIHKH